MVDKNMSVSTLSSFFSRILGDKQNSPIDELSNLLQEFQENPIFEAFKDKIQHSLTILEDLKKLVAKGETKLETHAEFPLNYFKKFYTQYQNELKDNPDIAIGMFNDIITTLESFLNAMSHMSIYLSVPEVALSIKSGVETQCTLDKFGCKLQKQKAFHCIDCSINGTKMICEGCAVNCHSGHTLIAQGNITGFCDCRFVTSDCVLEQSCTFEITRETFVPQIKYVCKTCNMKEDGSDMLCHFCIIECHKGHEVKTVRGVKGFCDCRTLFECCKIKPKE